MIDLRNLYEREDVIDAGFTLYEGVGRQGSAHHDLADVFRKVS
jgi:hypothetical protein